VLEHPEEKRHTEIERLAEILECHPRTVRRWLDQLTETKAVGRKTREDKGNFRIHPHTYSLVIHTLISNPPTTSINMIHRTLLRAAPAAMNYEDDGIIQPISSMTVRRIKQQLLNDPFQSLLFSDADHRREYIRTYSGEVISGHANDLWELDMTRCDIEVFWPEQNKVARPRVHACIDIYSGCIPGIVFSLDEDQTQTDLLIMRSIMPKAGPFAEKYPVWGIPQRLYWDNGKTYVSAHSERYLKGLNIESIHSLPKTSHTRGGIERFFGTLHNFERSLIGYVGMNAQDKSTEELKRLRNNTLNWVERGFTFDPGPYDRLMTITEYQNAVLAWLVGEYHAWQVDGSSRLEHFVSTAPENSRLQLDEEQLFLLMARREERLVNGNGSIRFDNMDFIVPDGSLINYQGRKVFVLRDQFVNETKLLCCWQTKTGALEPIGWAVPAPTVSSSLEAGDYRRNSKAKAQKALADAKQQREALRNPELMVSKQLMKEMEVTIHPQLEATAKARLAAVKPEEPDLGDWGKTFTELNDISKMTPEQILEGIKKHN
jgi:putative transposase